MTLVFYGCVWMHVINLRFLALVPCKEVPIYYESDKNRR